MTNRQISYSFHESFNHISIHHFSNKIRKFVSAINRSILRRWESNGRIFSTSSSNSWVLDGYVYRTTRTVLYFRLTVSSYSHVLFSPLVHRVQYWNMGFPFLSQRIFNFRWNLIILLPVDYVAIR